MSEWSMRQCVSGPVHSHALPCAACFAFNASVRNGSLLVSFPCVGPSHKTPIAERYGNDELDEDIMNASYHDAFIAHAENASATVSSLSGGNCEVW